MKEQEIINELDSIIAYCDLLKEKATELREKLNRFDKSASPKRGISKEEIAKIIAARNNFLNKKAMKNGHKQN